MKPSELYNLWTLFDKATSDPSFNADQRYSVGLDMFNALPPEMLCSSSKPSLSVVHEAMEGRLNDIDNERRKSKTGLRAGDSPVAGSRGNNGQENEGDGVSLAGVVGIEKPTKKARKGPTSE